MLALKYLYRTMMRIRLFGISIMGVCGLLVSLQTFASINIAAQELVNLRNMQTDTLFAKSIKPHIIMFMQPDCPWCKKQSSDLAKIVSQCGAIVDVSILGFKGNKNQLRREARYYDPSIPIFAASTQIMRQFAGIDTSPTFVILDSNNAVISKRVGYIKPQKLNAALAVLSDGKCELG